ncbi:MAG: AarF/UbiB family protein, partial [Rikenellaceae bacterium]
VMEKVEGVTPDSRKAILDANLDPEEVVKNGADTILQMILKFGMFHADPHPGNLFIGKGNVIGIIDFGMVGILRPKEIDFIADFIVSFYKRDDSMLTASLLTLCDIHYFDYYDELQFDIKNMLMQNMTNKSLDMKNLSRIMQKSIDLLIKHNLQIPSGIFLLIKTFATIEKFAQNIAPKLELSPIAMPYAKSIIKERYSTRRFAESVYETFTDYIDFIRELPTNLNEIIFKLKEGKIKHDIQLTDDTLFTQTLKSMTLRISYVILLIGLFIGSTILIVWDSDRRFGLTILYISTVLICGLLIKWIVSKK